VDHGIVWGVPRLEGSVATGTLTVTGTNGVLIPENTIWQRSDGLQYKSVASATISAGQTTVSIQSLEVGLKFNALTGSSFSIISPIAGVNSTAIASAFVSGSDQEALENWRIRILRRIQFPPGAGTVKDYETWARNIPNVSRAWCTPLIAGAGTVGVHFMMDDAYPNGIPQEADRLVVLDALNELKPVPAQLSVVIPTAQTIDLDIELDPDSSQTRQNVENALKQVIQEYSAPGQTFPVSKLREAISTAQGEFDHILNSPIANIPATSANHIHVLGSITWS
jgi:uncharacterized phage protein gp47/JayE